MTIINSVGETPSSLGCSLLLVGSQLSSVLGKSLLMSPSFFLFISIAVALLSKCPLLTGLSLSVLSLLHHPLSTASLLRLRGGQCTHPLTLRPLNMKECITRATEDTIHPSVNQLEVAACASFIGKETQSICNRIKCDTDLKDETKTFHNAVLQ